ncbi:MAG: DUF5103 domain-containing protein [Flavobacteriales bacterium]|nr:DUF5103 domain-containing protein [Flavobacteriales bacterium]MBT4705349.1 DUF5103 domain-containing protein [Flavobacteriales bacterium]MBT5132274.1 DUF5103 domain-containing protein [Flavobacteriales bacterium]MBT6382496.1 DUF5103 domain-containing protein [Flavobacteriales bacterium]MBT6916121.1 DUF5103 domain-containing protein [Flavobacteriales bacterium]
MRIGIYLCVTVLAPSLGMAQLEIDGSHGDVSYYDSTYLRYDNYTYAKNVKTVLLHPKGWKLGPPVIELNEEGSILELHFDVLDSAMGNYMYTVIHCDHDWTQSDLDVQEYLDGPPEDYLTDYDFSRNTFQKFTHYYLDIPNFNIRITKSGNYLLKVFDSDDREKLILTRRFCVTEDLIKVEAKVKQATMVKQRYSHQEIDFSIIPDQYMITNPYRDLHVVVLQNHSWEMSIDDLEPRFVKEDRLDYDYEGQNAMSGMNEFRLIDISNPRFTGYGVASVKFNQSENHAYLEQDKSRLSKVYLQREDMNGWYFVKNDLFGGEGTVDADYVSTHFSLKQDKAIADGDVYIYGALTDWRIVPHAKMTYNQKSLQYENTLYLKQGLYNYCYAFVYDGEYEPDLMRFEGAHFQTENEYSILVYHRQLGRDFDRLLSFKTIKYPSN